MTQTLPLFSDLVLDAPPTQGIKYAGSKLKLIPQILQLAKKTDAKTVLDGFSGTTRVSQALAKRGYTVVCNDIAVWSEVFAACYLLNDKRREEYQPLVDHLNSIPPVDGWFTEHYGGQSNGGCAIQQDGRKKPWQVHNSRRLDAIRQEIEALGLDTVDRAVALTSLILALDKRGPQVLVEAQIVEVQMGNGTELDSAFNMSYFDKDKDTVSAIGSVLGGRKGYPNADGYPEESGGWYDLTPLNKELSNGDIIKINAKLKWLETIDKAEILSSPNLLVDLGTTATVSTGTDQPLLNVSVNNGVSQESVYYKRTGVNLRVTPQLINEDAVTIEVRPEVTSVVGYASLSSSSEPPIISVRNIETKLNVKDGGVVMMGGLYSSKDIESEEKVPFFGDLPLIGFLFRSKSTDKAQVQLVFLLRVSIVRDAPVTLLTNLDTTQEEVKGVGAILKQAIAPEKPAGAESVPAE